MPKFIIKDTEQVFITYEYEVEAESKEEAIEKYTNELAGSLACKNEYVSDEETESITAEKQ